MEPKFSLLIANFNNGHYFSDCFRSLIAQTEKNWEAIVIDDASTDNSVEIISEMIKNDERFRFFQNEKNLGYQRTIIKAIELSKAPVFARLDPDDTISPTAVERSLETHELFPEVGLAYSNLSVCDENLNVEGEHQAKQVNSFGPEYYNFYGEISAFASFKRRIYDLTPGIDPHNKRAEDKDIYMKMVETAPVKHIDEVLYQYRVHGTSASSTINVYRADFWHMVALMKMAERRNINIEDVFVERYIQRRDCETMLNHERSRTDRITNTKVYKLMQKSGVFKYYQSWKSR